MQRDYTQLSVTACIGFLAGVVVCTLLIPWLVVLVCLLCACASVSVQRIEVWICACTILFGVGYAAWRTPEIQSEISITHGVVSSVSEQNQASQKFIVHTPTAVVQVTAPAYPHVALHDSVSLNCNAQRPSSLAFAYEQYLWSQGITHVCRVWGVDIVQHSRDVFTWAWQAQEDSIHRVQESLNEPASSLVLSMVFGRDTALSQDIISDFRITGLTHVLVVSGMQILLLLQVAEYVASLLRLSRIQQFVWIASVSIWYVVLTGAQASIVRAALTVGLSSLLRIKGRVRGNVLRILLCVAAIMACMHPYQLVYDVGFQLSCAAVLGLLLLAPRIQERLRFVPSAFAHPIAQSVGASLCSAPVIAWHFHTLSLIGIVANVVLAQAWSIATLFGFAWTALVIILPSLAPVAQLPCVVGFRILIFLVHFFASIPHASLSF